MKLYLFTATFPFGTSETFLEDEIIYLCDSFDTVEIIPFSSKGTNVRTVPKNCIVNAPVYQGSTIKRYICGLFHIKTFRLYLNDFFKCRVYTDRRRFKTWIISLVNANNLLKSSVVDRIFNNITTDDVCYSYWGKCSNILSVVYKGKAHFVSRYHGEWDLWEESSGNYAPIRKEEASSLDMAFFISQKGERYFQQRYPMCRTMVMPLGSKDYGVPAYRPQDGILRVVSCSTVYPLKRVDLIFEALNSLSTLKIEWTHLGGGSHFENLKQKILIESKPHLTVNLTGMMSHDEVMQYYQTHQFDIFINMSTNEGVPVSIMEACSFGIPILATDVGGTSEIVQKQVGLLLSPNPSVNEIIGKIMEIKSDSNFSPRQFWAEYYSADKNYSDFAKIIRNL